MSIRILVVDDEAEVADLLTQWFRQKIESGDYINLEEWCRVQSKLPDAVNSDMLLLGLDSHKILVRPKSLSTIPYVAIILPRLPTEGAHPPEHFNLTELCFRLHRLLWRQPAAQQVLQEGAVVNTVQSKWLSGLYTLLEKHLDKSDLSVEWLAEQLMMSRKTLLRKMQTLLRIAPSEFIQQYRLRRAAELLRAGHPVAETAYLVGFNTPAYFGQCFKEFYQTTPREYARTT